MRKDSKKFLYLAIILNSKSMCLPCLSQWTNTDSWNQMDYAKDEFGILQIMY